MRVLVRIAACASVGLLTVVPANADPAQPPWMDPHYPDKMHGNCAGGSGGAFGFGWCDGAHYPDGSYWHQIVGSQAWGTKPTCVIDTDTGQQPAPPGGCGGAS